MNVLQLLASSNFLTVNMAIAKQVGNDAAILLAELASSQVYFERAGQLTEDGMFFETVDQVEEATNLSKYQQAKAIKKLEEVGVLRSKVRGVPAKRYFCIDGEKAAGLVDNKKSKNLTAGGQKTLPQEVKKLDRNYKRITIKENNKRIIKGSPVNNTVENSSLSEPVKEKVKDFLAYREELKKPFKSERGVRALVAQIEKQEQLHGATAVIACIDTTMQNGWQGIFWEKIPKAQAEDSASMAELARMMDEGVIV